MPSSDHVGSECMNKRPSTLQVRCMHATVMLCGTFSSASPRRGVRVTGCAMNPNQTLASAWTPCCGSGSSAGIEGDCDCSAKCTAAVSCTAWSCQSSTNVCDLTSRAVAILFTSASDRNSRLRCARNLSSLLLCATPTAVPTGTPFSPSHACVHACVWCACVCALVRCACVCALVQACVVCVRAHYHYWYDKRC
jgi:hypothetical protein